MPRSLSLETIQARINELQKKADAIKTKAKPGVEKVVALIKKHKLTPDDLKDAFSAKRGRSAKTSKGTKKAKRTGQLKRKKVPVKFRDDKGNKWSGRGMTPKWILAAEKAGKDRSLFAVK